MADDKRVDEGWKEKARAEKGPGAEAPPAPPASFQTLVAMFAGQAMRALGLIVEKEGEAPPTPDLAQAKTLIDLLGVLEEKTKGNLEPDEAALLRGVLTDLRMAFVQASGVRREA